MMRRSNMMQHTKNGAQYTFEGFEVTKCNKNAFEKAKQFAENADAKPLAIFGETAAGKTHLLYAVRNAIEENDPAWRVILTTTAEMESSLAQILRDGGTAGNFRAQYLRADVLLVDDVQETAGRKALQTELVLLFNAFYEFGKRFMMTSNQKEYHRELDDRLVIRGFWGDFAVITRSYLHAQFPSDPERNKRRKALLISGENLYLALWKEHKFHLDQFRAYYKEVWQYFGSYIRLSDIDRRDVQIINDLNRIAEVMRCKVPVGVERWERQTCLLFLDAMIYTLSEYDIQGYRGGFYGNGVLFVPLPHHAGTSDMAEITLDEFEQEFASFCDEYRRRGHL